MVCMILLFVFLDVLGRANNMQKRLKSGPKLPKLTSQSDDGCVLVSLPLKSLLWLHLLFGF